MEQVLPNYLKAGLKILFVGINPGLRSAEVGHHFAGYSNRFWKFLAESGMTPFKLEAVADRRLLEFDYGITNIVSRPSATAAELSPSELKAGALVLLELIREYRPKTVAYLGKVSYQYLSGRKDFSWGKQEVGVVDGVIDFVLPNPSGLNRMPFAEQLGYYRELEQAIGNRH